MQYFENTIKAQIEKVKAREPRQPYLNLVNLNSTLSDVFSKDNIAVYEEMQLKSLYFRVETLELSDDLATHVKTAAKLGIKEILILCPADSHLTSDAFNEFLQTNQISINLEIATFKDGDLEKIRAQEIGSRDLLAFEDLQDYKFVYPDGVVLPMLNNRETDATIEKNYQTIRDAKLKTFEYKAPKYIAESQDWMPGTQITAAPTFEVTVQVQAQTQVSAEVSAEAESEASVDQAQLDDSLSAIGGNSDTNGSPAKQYFCHRKYHGFYDQNIHSCLGDSMHCEFFVPTKIKRISKKALNFMAANRNYEVRLENFPIGLAFDKKTGLLFLSDNRPSSMPINDLTVPEKWLQPRVTSPTEYSWLHHARFGTRTLSEIYETDLAPKIYTSDTQHLLTLWFGLSERDVPFALCHGAYGPGRRISNEYHQNLRAYSKKKLDNIFPDIEFSESLSNAEKQKLGEIWLQLEIRKIHKVFIRYLQAQNNKEAGFMLEDDGQAFFDKLFNKILPSSDENDHKLKFFQDILDALYKWYSFKQSLDDIFEGLSGAYEKFKEFLVKEDIDQGSQQFEDLFSKFRHIVFMHLKEHNKGSWKILILDVLKVFQLNSENGGSIAELFEYLEINFDLASVISKMEQYKLGIAHPALIKNDYDDDSLTAPNVALTVTADPMQDFNQALIALAAVPTHQRASINSWTKYYRGSIKKFEWSANCNDVVPHSALHLLTIAPTLDSIAIENKVNDNTNIDVTKLKGKAKEAEEASRLRKLQELLDQERAKLHDGGNQCTPSIGIVTEHHDLVQGFTKPELNLPLLTLAMAHSSGVHYDALYPTQDFPEYVALINILFAQFKVQQSIEGAKKDWKAVYSYNDNRAVIQPEITSTDRSQSILDLEKKHEEAVATFLNIAKNPEFSYGEIMLLGMIQFFEPTKGANAINYAKQLKAIYGKSLYYAMRTAFLKGPNGRAETVTVETIKNRASNLFDYLEFLNQPLESGNAAHALLTKNGANPENLVLLAAYHSKYIGLHGSSIQILHDDIRYAPQDHEYFLKVLQGLPLMIVNEGRFLGPVMSEYTGSIERWHLNRNFGQMLQNRDEVLKSQTKFNTLGDRFDAIQPSLGALENRYKVVFKFKGDRYYQVRNAIIKNPKYLPENVQILDGSTITNAVFNKIVPPSTRFSKGHKPAVASKQKSDFIKELAGALLAVFTRPNNEPFHKEFIDIAFDPNLSLQAQLTDLEFSKNIFEQNLLKRCAEQDRYLFVKALKDAAIPPKFVREIFVYLKALSTTLATANMSLLQFVELVPKEMYQNPNLLSTVTNFGFENKLSLKELYTALVPFVLARGIESFIGKMLEECRQKSSYKSLEILKAINIKAKDSLKKFEWIMQLKLNEIENLVQNSHLNLKRLFKLKDLNKITVFKDIALQFKQILPKEKYDALISFIETHDLNDAKLVRSYLKSSKDTNVVFDNLNSLDVLQAHVFAENNLRRFEYDTQKIKDKLKTVKEIRTESTLSSEEQDKLFEEFKQVMQHAKDYSHYDYNQIRMEALKLRHERRMAERGDPETLHALNLKFLGLSSEALYRETGKFPRYHQVFANLIMMMPRFEGNLIEELATGEGKSIISALHVAHFWFLGQKVDALTSNEYLATGDLEEFAPFYEALGIKYAQHVIKPDSEPTTYTNAEVAHSTLSNKALFLAQLAFNSLFSSNPVDKAAFFALKARVHAILDEGDDLLKSPINFKLAAPLFSMSKVELSSLLNFIIAFSTSKWFGLQISPEDRAANLKTFLIDQLQQRGLHFPLSLKEAIELQKNDPQLYALYHALVKLGQNDNQIFIQLLESLEVAKNLLKEKDKAFVIQTDQKVCEIVPIINSIAQPGVVFGKVVHQLLEELLKRDGTCKEFKDSTPSGAISDVSPKVLVDYYTQTGGGVTILTATPGDSMELREFCDINQVCHAVLVPRYNINHRTEPESGEKLKFEEMIAKAASIASDTTRPVLIYVDYIVDALAFYKALSNMLPQRTMFLCSGSDQDSKECDDIENTAGKNSVITITTQMHGRGMDCKIGHAEGAVLINACTDITKMQEVQVNGRVGRDGKSGTVYRWCNTEIVGDKSCEQHMKDVSFEGQVLRLRNQPLADVLNYPHWGFSSAEDAIKFNTIVEKKWKAIVQSVPQITIENTKALREKLVKAMADIPQCSGKIDDLEKYLQQIDAPYTTALKPLGNFTSTRELYQPKTEIKAGFWLNILNSEPDLTGKSKSLSVKSVQIPTKYSTSSYKIAYKNYLSEYYITMFTHIFSLPDTLFDFGGKKFKGEGSNGNLMLEEFKVAFSNFQLFNNSPELDALRVDINKFVHISKLSIRQLQADQWYPISITTKVDSENSHAESILFNFDRGVLLWVNGENGGIKIYKIRQSFERLQEVLEALVDSKSQTDTRQQIWSLSRESTNLAEETDKTEPDHLTISMPKQDIGNCGWVQVEGMLKALIFIQYFDFHGDFVKPETVQTREWQMALQYTNLYPDFQQFNKAAWLEAAVCLSAPEECKPEFLNSAEQDAIKAQRKATGEEIITPQLLARTAKAAVKECEQSHHSIYEASICKSAQSLSVHAVFGSEMGKKLQEGTTDAKFVVNQCFICGNLEDLYDHYKTISVGHFSNTVDLFAEIARLACIYGADPDQIDAYLLAVGQHCDQSSAANCLHEQAESYIGIQ